MALIFPPLCRDEDGLLSEIVGAVTPGSHEYMGMWVSPSGLLQCTVDAPAYYNHGLPFNNGLLCVSNQAVAYVRDSVPFSATGAVVLVAGTVAYVEQGVPFTALGEIVADDVAGGGPQTPIWGAMPPLSHFEWELKQDFPVSGYTYTNGDSGPITDYRLVGAPAGFTISSEGVISCAPGTAPGNYTLTIEALNSVGWSTVPGTLSWEIKAGAVPVWDPILNFTTAETSLPREYNVEAFVTAPDEDPVQAYTLDSAPAGFMIPDPSRGIIRAVDPIIAVHTIQISATNNAGKSLPAEFDWEITLGNYVPIWGNIPLISSPLSLLPDTHPMANYVTSPNPVDGVVTNYQLINSPPNFTIDPVTGVVTASDLLLNGSYTLYASAQNDVGTGYSQAITWEIIDNYELIYDFTAGMPTSMDYFRSGDARTNDLYGESRVSPTDLEMFPGAALVNDMWLGTSTTYGMQMGPEVINLITANYMSAGEWAVTGGYVMPNQVIGDDLGGVILHEDANLSAHYVHPFNDTTAIAAGNEFVVGVFIKRDPGQRYIVVNIGLDNTGAVLNCWAFVDTMTWLISDPIDEENSQFRMYDMVASPNKDGEYARIVAKLHNRSGAARNARLTVGGATGMTGGWDDAYQGTLDKIICTAYNFEVVDHPVVTSATAPGETRGNSNAVDAISATPGSRVNDIAFHVIFRYPWSAGSTVVNDRIWRLLSTDPQVGIEVKEAGGSDIIINLLNESGPIGSSQVRFSIADMNLGQAIDIRGSKTSERGFEAWILLDANQDYDEDGSPLPLDWLYAVDDSAEAKADLSVPVDYTEVGSAPEELTSTAPFDMVSVRIGFGDYSEEDIKAWPTWEEPPPIPTVHPDDFEVIT